MSSPFSAGDSALGYLFQARYALYLGLTTPEEWGLSVEQLDDIAFEEAGTPLELLQLKHHSTPASLSDASPDLWKTLRVWSNALQSGNIILPGVVLTIITTARAPMNSIADQLRPKNSQRDLKAIVGKLEQVANDSQNQNLTLAFKDFLSLSSPQKENLVNAVQVLDLSPNIEDTKDLIKKKLTGVHRKHRDSVYERLEGWWFDQIVKHLSGKFGKVITNYEIHERIADIADQFKPDALPEDFLYTEPPVSPDPDNDNRQFVLQLKMIDAHVRLIEKAISDYYKAFEQRSRWAREDLLDTDEFEKYEKRLIDEWERFFYQCLDDFENSEEELKKCGQEVFRWMNAAPIPIRPQATAPYISRGSYHILANEVPPRVWWHPKFAERIRNLLTTPIG